MYAYCIKIPHIRTLTNEYRSVCLNEKSVLGLRSVQMLSLGQTHITETEVRCLR